MKNNNIKVNTPKSVFTHLLGIVAFYASIAGFIILLFQYINVLFPDQLYFYYDYENALSQIRVSMSILIVSFPVYLLMTFLLNKEIFKNKNMREFKLRKWLLYFTLFISAITIIGDLITVIFKFLDGELSIRFYLKTLIIFIVAGSVFWYYIWDIKRELSKKTKNINKSLAYIASVIVFASIISGFFIVGSPSKQRMVKFDIKRVNNMQILQNEIINYWINKGSLPENLDNLKNNISGFNSPLDPKTNKSYEYNTLNELSFELCATFETSNKDIYKKIKETQYMQQYPYGVENWNHEKGITCFKRNIDPDIYKNNFPFVEKILPR